MIRFVIRIPAMLLLVVASYLLAPFAIAFFSTEDKRHLTRFKWLETIDNDLTGENKWRTTNLWGSDPRSWINRTRWLWRNGGNYVNYNILGCRGDADWNVAQDRSVYYWKRPDGYWLYRRFIPISKTKNLELFFGWNLFSIKQGYCKVVCQIRIKSKVA